MGGRPASLDACSTHMRQRAHDITSPCQAPAGFPGSELERLEELAGALAVHQEVLRSQQLVLSLLG